VKVGLNATCFNDRPSGARQRFIGIYGALIRRLKDAEFVIYEPRDCRVASWFDGAANVSARVTPIPSAGRWQKLVGGRGYWAGSVGGESFDIFEGFNLPPASLASARTLLTIHDIRGMSAGAGALRRSACGAILNKSLAATDHVVTVSESMKNQLLASHPDMPVSVVYNGLDAGSFAAVRELDLQQFRGKFGVPEAFILAVGHFEKRKNYLRLVEAVSRQQDRGVSCYLVIIGNDSGQRGAVERRIQSLGISTKVKILSGLSDLEVRCAYKLCSLFVFPSSYEGFGIPVLEAMAAGCPTVLSDIPVFREITQNKGVYFAHDQVESMASAIETLLSSTGERQRLIAYGNERVKDFTFGKLAAQMESLYRTLA
jgi:glycosyltransferase involved in cell wall biosynthesis